MSSQENHAMPYNIVFIKTAISVIIMPFNNEEVNCCCSNSARLITRFDNKYNHSSNKCS